MSTCPQCTRLANLTDDQRLTGHEPTNWWHCPRCGTHLERYRGTGDTTCPCGATFNAFGQRLRDDWAHNHAWHDDDLDDLEGFERASLTQESRRTL